MIGMILNNQFDNPGTTAHNKPYTLLLERLHLFVQIVLRHLD
jgi:hypothetical protein